MNKQSQRKMLNLSLQYLSLKQIFSNSPYTMGSFSNKYIRVELHYIYSSFCFKPFVDLRQIDGINIKESLFSNYLSSTIIVDAKCANLKLYTSVQSFGSGSVVDCYFINITNSGAGGAFLFNNMGLKLFVTGCHFINTRTTGSFTTSSRSNAAGGGFCSVSLASHFSRLCFSYCSATKAGGAFFSQVPNGAYQFLNDSTVFSCSTSIHNGWSSDWGYIMNIQVNATYMYCSDGNSCGYRETSDGVLTKYCHFAHCTAKQTSYGIIGDYSQSSAVQCTMEYINFISNTADKSIISLSSASSITTIIRHSTFIGNVAPSMVIYVNVKPQFINCWGQSAFSTAQGSYSNCNFINQNSPHPFFFNYCTCKREENTSPFMKTWKYTAVVFSLFIVS